MNASLEKQAMHGASWSFIERYGQHSIQFIVSLILARILEPEDFGVLGMILIFFALGTSIVDCGFGQALVQKQDCSKEDESTIFWFNLLVGLIMTTCLFLSAPWIASFYDLPLLKPVTQVYSVNLFINSFGIVQNALLMKELAFRKRMLAVLSSVIISGIVGVLLACRGYGVWALVIQILIMNVVKTVGLWVVHEWRPLFIFSVASLKGLWKFGSHLMIAGLSNTFFDNIYFVIIGRMYSAAEIGFYQRGKQLVALSANSLSQVISQVNFPVLSRVQDDRERMREISVRTFRVAMLVILPIMVGFILVAPALIQALFGEKWLPCIPYFRLLSVIGILYPLHLLNLDILKALGRSDLVLRLEFFKKGLVILNIMLTWHLGISALLAGQVCCSLISLLPNTFYNAKFLSFGLKSQLSAIVKNLIASLCAAGIVFLLNGIFPINIYSKLVLQSVLFAGIWGFGIWLLKDPACRDVALVIKNRYSEVDS